LHESKRAKEGIKNVTLWNLDDDSILERQKKITQSMLIQSQQKQNIIDLYRLRSIVDGVTTISIINISIVDYD
jgi:hypothetical protein